MPRVATVASVDSELQRVVVVKPRIWRNGVHRGLIYCNGWSRRALDVLGGNGPNVYDRNLAAAAAGAGFTVLAHDFTATVGGAEVDGWGSTDVTDKVGEVHGDVASTYHAQSGAVCLVAVSMGAVAALNYLRRVGDPSTIAAIALLNPVVDLEYVHNNDAQPFLQASLDSVHTTAGARDANSPLTNVSEIEATGVTIRVWYSHDDTVASAASTRAFVSQCSTASLRDVGATGHLIDDHPMVEIAAWLARQR